MDRETALRIQREAEASARHAWFSGEPEPANPQPRHTPHAVLWATTWYLTFENLTDAAEARKLALASQRAAPRRPRSP